MSRTVVAIVAGAVLGGAAAPGAEEPTRGRWQTETRETLGGAVNPVGLQNVLERSWTRPLFASKRTILADAHVAFGAADRLTPAYNRFGVWAELAPLSVLELRAGIEPVAYFGTFKSLLSFPSYDARFDDRARDARGADARFAVAGRAYLSPVLKARLGPIVTRVRADFEWWRARTDGPFFYEPTRDTLLRARSDAMMTSEAVLLWEHVSEGGRKLLVGPVHDMTWVYDAPQNRKQDLGVLGILVLGHRVLGLREPAIYVKIFRYVEDPYKTGELGAQIAIGCSPGRAQ